MGAGVVSTSEVQVVTLRIRHIRLAQSHRICKTGFLLKKRDKAYPRRPFALEWTRRSIPRHDMDHRAHATARYYTSFCRRTITHTSLVRATARHRNPHIIFPPRGADATIASAERCTERWALREPHIQSRSIRRSQSDEALQWYEGASFITALVPRTWCRARRN